jgi:NhaP-type Na+/H+ or K+/H+ antiporter
MELEQLDGSDLSALEAVEHLDGRGECGAGDVPHRPILHDPGREAPVMHGWSLAVIAAVVLVYAVVSGRLERTPVTAAIFFVSCGFLFGDKGLGWIEIGSTSESVRALAEVTLTLVLFADASRIDVSALRREYLVPARLLGIGLPLTIVAGCLVAAVSFDELSFGEALLLAIILAPTDAALGQAVVTDERLPSRIRQGLNVESGLNDGICVPLLYIALALSGSEAHSLTTSGAVALVAKAIGYGVLFGVLAGAVGALLLRLGGAFSLTDAAWAQVVPLGTAALSYGLAAPLGGSGFIAAFVAGFTFGVARRRDDGSGRLLEEFGGLANAATFVVFGAAIVGPILTGLTWTAALYGVLSLTVVRMLPVAVAFAGTKARLPTVAFLGWFGPRGLASIVFGVIVIDETTLPHTSTIAVVVVFTILLSVFAHGVSALPLTGRYARWYRSHPEDHRPPMEAVHAEPQRWRRSPPVPAP